MSIQLTSETRLLSEFSAVNCAPGGGRTERIAVPFHHAKITLPPSDLDALGFVVAEEISALCETVNLDGLRIGRISGILGNPRKIWRYEAPDFWKATQRILQSPLDCLILHQGPLGSKRGMRGAGMINEAIRAAECNPGMN